MAQPLVTPAAIETIRRGGLVIFPTETLYGLGCVARHEAALRRLFEAKGRPPGQPPPVLVANAAQMSTLVDNVPLAAASLIAAHWPGALTIVLPARGDVSPLLTGLAADGKTRTIGVRHSAHEVAQLLCEKVGAPLVATSANRAGAVGRAANPHRIDDIPISLQQCVDVIIDGGEVMGEPSTVVDCTVEPPRVLRQGVLRLQF